MGRRSSYLPWLGRNSHNVDFTGPAPTSCVQTAGTVGGAVPPLPTNPSPMGWAGNCRFDTPGTYEFVCQAHPQMVGQVVVAAATSTPTPIPQRRHTHADPHADADRAPPLIS